MAIADSDKTHLTKKIQMILASLDTKMCIASIPIFE